MNADAMSRRPGQQDHLQSHEEATEYQSSPPPKFSNQEEATKTQPSVGIVSATMVVTNLLSVDLRRKQLEDDTTGPILQAKEADGKPDSETLRRYSKATRQLFQLWDQLVVIDSGLYWKFEHFRGKRDHLQLVVPNCMRDTVLKESYESWGTFGRR